MLARRHRLTRERDIRRVLRHGRRFHGSSIIVRFLSHSESTQRFTVVVSAKVSKRATVRNRLKRQIRGFLARRRGDLPQRADYLISVRPGPPAPTPRRISDDLTTLIRVLRR